MAKLHVIANRLGVVPDIASMLVSLNELYVGLIVLDKVAAKADRRHRGPSPEEKLLRAIFGEKSADESTDDSKFDLTEEISIAKGTTSPLELASVSFASPGFWEFLGELNPLQQIREWLKDRHERKKDIDFRNEQERDSGFLKNEAMFLGNLESKIKILRNVGVPEEEIREKVTELLGVPTRQLASAFAQEIIEDAEIVNDTMDPENVETHT
jgi:hypothetical protein